MPKGIARLVWVGGLCLALALAGVPAAAAEGDSFDMEGAVLKALKDNPKMASAQAAHRAQIHGVDSAEGALYPSLSTSYSYTRRDHKKSTRNYPTSAADLWELNFNVHQDLFTGWKLLSNHQRAMLSRDKAEANIANTELSLVSLVQENFLSLLKARQSVRSAGDSVTRLKSQLKVTQAFYDVGLKPRLDVLEAEVDLADAEDQLLQARNTLATQVARLNTLLDLPLDKPVEYKGELTFSPFSLTLEQCLDEAYKKRPDLAIAHKAVEVAQKDVTIAYSGLYPQVGADLDWYHSGSKFYVQGSGLSRTEYSYWQGELSASWTVFDWDETRASGRKAEEIVRQLMADESDSRLEAGYEVKSRHLKIAEAAERITVARKSLESAKEGYRMAVARYQAQVGTNTDVLDAQARLSRAETGLTEAMADYQIALSRLYVSIGQKNPSLATQ